MARSHPSACKRRAASTMFLSPASLSGQPRVFRPQSGRHGLRRWISRGRRWSATRCRRWKGSCLS